MPYGQGTEALGIIAPISSILLDANPIYGLDQLAYSMLISQLRSTHGDKQRMGS